jgi:hypothetical protein
VLRYLLIATAIVFLIGGIAAALHRGGGDLRMASVQTTSSPSPPRRQAASTFAPGPLTGDAPWALSAVPECFHQVWEARGSLPFTLSHLPRDAAPLRAGATAAAADCVVYVRTHDVLLVRGSERLRVPPRATLYVLPEDAGLALLRSDGGSNEARIYRPIGALKVHAAPEAGSR